MKKQLNIIGIILLASTIFACSETEKKEEKNSTTENKPEEVVDTLTVEEKSVTEFKNIEEYATLVDPEKAKNYFGEENIKSDTSWYAEGTVMMLSSRCLDPHSGAMIQLVWSQEDPDKLSHVEASHHVYDKTFTKILKTQKLMSESGVFTGMTMKELVAFNGAEFNFSGFGWDYAGGLMPKDGSKIQKTNLGITMDLNQSDDAEASMHLLGDMMLNSGTENVKNHKIFVDELVYYAK